MREGGFYETQDHGRQRGRRLRKLRLYRGRDHLPHHALQPHGGACGHLGRQRDEKHLRPERAPHGDAERGRGLRGHARLAGGGGPHHQLHRQPGPDADGAAAVPDFRPAPPRRHSCGRPDRGHQRLLHLRGPLRRDGLPPDGLCPAGQLLRAGVHGFSRRGPPFRHQKPGALYALLRRLPHQP